MDNLALSVSKSIAEYLEQNEKRLVSQRNQLESQIESLNRALVDFKTKLETKCEQLERENITLKDEVAGLKQREEKSASNIILMQSDIEKMQDWKAKFETKCEELEKENKTLKDAVVVLKEKEERSAKNIIIMQSDIERMQEQAKHCGKNMELLKEITEQVLDLNNIRNQTQTQIATLYRNQDRQQKIIAAVVAKSRATPASVASTAATPPPFTNAPRYNVINRTPVRSPSTSSFFTGNSNGHSSFHKYKTRDSNNTHNHYSQYSNEEYLSSLDGPDDLSEISENAEELKRNVEALQDLQRSFEKNSSICSG